MTTKFCLSLLLTIPLQLTAQQSGSIQGSVRSASTMESLPVANVLIVGSDNGAATDLEGRYTIAGMPGGTYSLSVTYIGFEPVVLTDVIVKPGRITHVDIRLEESMIAVGELTVTGGYFQKNRIEPVRIISFNAEEIRRAPGSAGDVSRIISSLPSIAHASDQANDIMVRGGSTMENGFYVDNIQVTNINHFGNQGSTGGPIGMLNIEFIDNVEFFAGGFSSTYGDRLSSIIDIEMRAGNREEVDLQIDLGMGGFGVVGEGPLAGGRGGWLGSYRRSYLDLISDAIGMNGIVPRYGDTHAKLDYDISSADHIGFLLLAGDSNIRYTKEDVNELGQPFYGLNEVRQLTVGTNWRHLWGAKGFTNTSLAYTAIEFNDNWNSKDDDTLVYSNASIESAIRLRNVNHYRHSKQLALIFGIDAALEGSDITYFYASGTDLQGEPYPEQTVAHDGYKYGGGVFANLIYAGIDKVSINISGRLQHNGFNGQTYVLPRILADYRLTNLLKFRGAWGIYRQSLPGFLQVQEADNSSLADLQAIHYVLGMDYLLTGNTQLSVDLYAKQYDHFPMEPDSPLNFVIDDAHSLRRFRHYRGLTDDGEAFSAGIEVLIQKKLAEKLYGLIGGTYYRSTYRDFDGAWRDRMQDNRFRMNIVAGYKPNNKLELSFRWNYASGAPYTPFDENASAEAGIGIYDEANLLGARYPIYHALNLRFDQRKYFKWGNMVSYFSVWNAYNRENVAFFYWNEVTNELDRVYNWSFMPVGGFELEF